jgi:hypothetical protein
MIEGTRDMAEGSGDATALLGMDRFVVLVMDRIEGECWLLVETTATVAGCPDCGVQAIGHGRSSVQVRDLPNGSGPVRLVWRKRRWKCPDPDCDRTTFTERSDVVEDHSLLGPGNLQFGRSQRELPISLLQPCRASCRSEPAGAF